MPAQNIQDVVKERYGRAARRVTAGESTCCGPASDPCKDPISSGLYDGRETEGLPEDAVSASLGDSLGKSARPAAFIPSRMARANCPWRANTFSSPSAFSILITSCNPMMSDTVGVKAV